MKISKMTLAKSGKKFYRFFYKDRESQNSCVEGCVIKRPWAMLEDSIFFADEENIHQWITHGDTLAEVVFSIEHPYFASLPDKYFVVGDKYCGNELIVGQKISINDPGMVDFICLHWDYYKENFCGLQQHLIFTKAIDTLEKLWDYRHLVLGEGNRKTEMANAVLQVKLVYLKQQSIADQKRYQECKDWDTIKELMI